MGIHRDKKGRWVVQVRATFGGMKWRECKRFPPEDERAAKEYLEDVEAEIRHLKRRERMGEDVRGAFVRAAASPSFSEHAERWMKGADVRPGTRKLYRQHLGAHLLPRFADREVRDIRTKDVLDLQAELKRGKRTPGGVNAILRVLSACLGDAVRRDLIQVNPCSRVRPLKGRKLGTTGHPLAVEQEERVLAEASPRWRRAWAFMLATGARSGETRAIRWKDLDADGVTFSRQYAGDGSRQRLEALKDGAVGSTRRVPWRSLRLRDVVFEGEQGSPDALLFATEGGGPIGEANARRAFQRLVEGRFGWLPEPLPDGRQEHYSPHDLRHTWATRLAEAGVPLEKLRQWGDWCSLELVQRYARVSDESALAILRAAEAGLTRDAQATRGDGEEA